MWQDVVMLTTQAADAGAAAVGLAASPTLPAAAPAAGAAAKAAAAPISLSPWQLILDAGPVVKLVLFVLIFASILCWAIVAAKGILLVTFRARSRRFLRALAQADEEQAAELAQREAFGSPHARLYVAAQREQAERPGGGAGDAEEGPVKRLERVLAKAVDLEVVRLEGWLGVLATIGSTAPFIGLFGTVWGIMSSFINIGAQQSATLAVVAPGIAEALIATAVGLVAAIPAVIAYNAFVRRVRVWNEDLAAYAVQLVNETAARVAGGGRPGTLAVEGEGRS